MTARDFAAAPGANTSVTNGVPPAESERFRLARLAREAALQVPGVTGTDPGPLGLFITVGGGRRLDGVVCYATRSGGYEIWLRLACRMVPLPPLSERVKAVVHAAALRDRLPLECVSVQVTDIAESP